MPKTPGQILIVSATDSEMILEEFQGADKLVSGVGMVPTTTALTKQLVKSDFDLVINIGIAGSFNSELSIGNVTQVTSDKLVEVGVEDNGKFIPADEIGLCSIVDVQFETNQRVLDLPKVNGITVNRVHGSVDSIHNVVDQFNPDMESMEGAAVAYVCQQFGIPWVQIRAISNKVEVRNRDSWNIPLAIKNLHTVVTKYLKCLDLEA